MKPGAATLALTVWETFNPVDPRRLTGAELDYYNSLLRACIEEQAAWKAEQATKHRDAGYIFPQTTKHNKPTRK